MKIAVTILLVLLLSPLWLLVVLARLAVAIADNVYDALTAWVGRV